MVPTAGDSPASALTQELERARTQIAEQATALQSERDRNRVLEGELQHSVRNVMALVRSIVRRSMDSATSLEDVDEHLSGRLSVIGRYAAPPPETRDVEHLIRDELSGFAFGYHDQITIDGPDAVLPADAMLPLAIAVHELVTNALKFGALSGENGRLTVCWALDRDALVMDWTESGTSILTAAPIRKGFGVQYILEALPYQLGATTEHAMRPGGMHCRISLPLHH